MNSLFIVWSDSHKSGVPILDEQSRCIASIINSFAYLHTGSGTEAALLTVTTAEMFYHTAGLNFFTLEQLMFESGYPHLEKYEKLHNKLRQALKQVVRKCRTEWSAAQLLRFMHAYWSEFIIAGERPYTTHLRAHYENACLLERKEPQKSKETLLPEEQFALLLEKTLDAHRDYRQKQRLFESPALM